LIQFIKRSITMIKVIKSGLVCSVQDPGRFGYRHLGVPISGWMDEKSALAANSILGNDEKDAVIEMGPVGMEILFLEETNIVLTGAPKHTLLNQKRVSFNSRLHLSIGDTIKIKTGNKGVWTYLAIDGGIQKELTLGSRSFYLPAKIGHTLLSGVELAINKGQNLRNADLNSRIKFDHLFNENYIRVRKGPEYDMLSDVQKQTIFNSPFTIGANSNRMGYYLMPLNSKLLSGLPDIITSVVSPGSIQLPPSGTPIALMKDCQTTGGYARILQVLQEDLSVLAQKRSDAKVYLSLYQG